MPCGGRCAARMSRSSSAPRATTVGSRQLVAAPQRLPFRDQRMAETDCVSVGCGGIVRRWALGVGLWALGSGLWALGSRAASERSEARRDERANAVSEPDERSEPAKRRASEAAGESEGRRPSDKEEANGARWPSRSSKPVASRVERDGLGSTPRRFRQTSRHAGGLSQELHERSVSVKSSNTISAPAARSCSTNNCRSRRRPAWRRPPARTRRRCGVSPTTKTSRGATPSTRDPRARATAIGTRSLRFAGIAAEGAPGEVASTGRSDRA